ncbi:hypothetical protein NDU88_008960 [Pleurodeles waltl]|uniref:Condensation domain-containing protein n=1 Tax=Pleurodeles waltl TaxID=8319 RepID=A0AAV7NY48_PLEWA|nr:hypothetical protein NDU88_008960 [Pleurodeles waltl]
MRLQPCLAPGPGKWIILLDHSVSDADGWLVALANSWSLQWGGVSPVASAGPGRGLEPWRPGAGVAYMPFERGDPRLVGALGRPLRDTKEAVAAGMGQRPIKRSALSIVTLGGGA